MRINEIVNKLTRCRFPAELNRPSIRLLLDEGFECSDEELKRMFLLMDEKEVYDSLQLKDFIDFDYTRPMILATKIHRQDKLLRSLWICYIKEACKNIEDNAITLNKITVLDGFYNADSNSERYESYYMSQTSSEIEKTVSFDKAYLSSRASVLTNNHNILGIISEELTGKYGLFSFDFTYDIEKPLKSKKDVSNKQSFKFDFYDGTSFTLAIYGEAPILMRGIREKMSGFRKIYSQMDLLIPESLKDNFKSEE